MGLLKTLLGGGHHASKRDHGHGYGHGAPSNCESDRAAGWGSAPAAAPGLACPSCRAPNAASARFCQSCGTSLVPKACSQCRAMLAAGAKFCGECGTAAP